MLNLTLHDNDTPNGQGSPSFLDAVVFNHSLNDVPEFGYGETPW